MNVTGRRQSFELTFRLPRESNKRQNAVIRLGCAPRYGGSQSCGRRITLIPDEITLAGERTNQVITAVMLHAVKILREAEGFYKQQTQHA